MKLLKNGVKMSQTHPNTWIWSYGHKVSYYFENVSKLWPLVTIYIWKSFQLDFLRKEKQKIDATLKNGVKMLQTHQNTLLQSHDHVIFSRTLWNSGPY